MADSILVALDETQHIQRFMPHLKSTARPGDTIIFLDTHGDINLGRRGNSSAHGRNRQHNLAGIPGKRMAIQRRPRKTESRTRT